MEETTTEIFAPQDDGASTTGDEEALQTLQREVQRKFGRAVLILQQYERLVKSLVAEKDLAGPITELQRIKEKQLKAVSKKTLGQVVGDLTGTLMTPALTDEASGDSEPYQVESSLPWIIARQRLM